MHFIDPSGALGVALLTAAHTFATVSVVFYPLEALWYIGPYMLCTLTGPT